MRTSELIELLSLGVEPVRPRKPGTFLGAAVAAGAAISLAGLCLWLGTQPMASAMARSWFWMKLLYSLALGLSGFLLLTTLVRPGGGLNRVGFALWVLALAAMGLMAAVSGSAAAPGTRTSLWLGSTWQVCPWRIVALAVPIFVALTVILRRLAPTRLLWSGAAAGLCAGGFAAAVYGFYCQETAAPFVATWYSAGIAGCAALGALFGRPLLRW